MAFNAQELEELVKLLLAERRGQAAPEAVHAVAAPAPVAAPAAPAATPPAASPGQTLGAWLHVYDGMLADRGYKPQTLKNQRANLAHVRRLWGHLHITELRAHAITTGLKEFALATSTQRRVLAGLRDAYTEAIGNDWCEKNPALHVKLAHAKIKRARLMFDTWAGMCELAQCGPQRWVESMLLLAFVTGQRRADLAKMRFDDIVSDDAGRQYLRIEQQKEAGKGYGARVEIPLSLRMDAICMTVGDVIEHCRGSARPGEFLLRKSGGGPIELSSLSTRFHETIVTVLGEDAHARHQWPSLHEVRSLSARTYHEQGLELKTIQTLLGHSNAEMTDLYINDRGLTAKEWKRVAVEGRPQVATETRRPRAAF